MTGSWNRADLSEAEFAELALEGLRERFPGVTMWFGEHTERFWALVPFAGFPGLLEAPTAQELAIMLLSLRCGRPGDIW